jgi:Tfp pilus assembly PilM family ATPase
MKLKLNMKLPPLHRHGPIGVDVGSRHVKAVQLARHGADGWRVVASASYPRQLVRQPFDAAEAARLCDVLDRQGFVGRNVVVGLSQDQLLTSMLELPPRAPGVPIDQIARMELARVHQRDAGSFEFAQWEVPPPARAAKTTHVMAVACAHEPADALLDVLEVQGLTVRALDAEGCATVRACRPLLVGLGGMGAVLDLGFAAARLSVVYHGVIVYSRSIEDASLESLYRHLGRHLEADEQSITQLLADDFAGAGGADEPRAVVAAHVDALVKEINTAFAYATHQYSEPSVAGLLLVGGGADAPGMGLRLGAALPVPVRIVTPAALVACDGLPHANAASMVPAIGLAMYREGHE